ncbi:MAG TPA: efflux RND transporter periplasmic adaptor subunit, partial [Gemmataceae bacterium]|nr:efflux RND transporter periplasmic adaptor subunit [Gemmataceae bacterium]
DPRDLARRLHLLGLPESVTRGTDPPPKTANLIPLKAPFDGVITRQDMVIGERATPDRSELTMADVRTMWVRLSVRKEDADRLALGQPVRFTSDAAPHVAEGKLAWISTAVDEKTRTVQARAVVKNPLAATAPPGDVENPRLLRANEYGTARVRVAHLDRAVLVPDKAIQRLMDRTPLVFVALPDGRTFEPRKVELGESRDGFTHVRSGVRAGERVATANSYVLKSELMKDTLVAGD